MCKFLIFFILILNPFFMYAQECEDEGDSLEKSLVVRSDFAKRNGYTEISRQDVSDTFKKFFPHDRYFYTDKGYYYKKSINKLRAELVISTLYCGVNNTILINCSDKDYSVLLALKGDNVFRGYYAMNYGLFLEPNSYNMLEKSIPNLTQRLNKETVLVIPVEIDIYDVYVNMLTGGVFSLKNLRILDKKEIDDYSFRQSKVEYDIVKILSSSFNLPGYLPIYTRSKDFYVNMRKEPNSNSEVVAQILTFFPLEDKYIRDIDFVDEKNRTETSCNYPHQGKDKQVASREYRNYFDYGVDRYGTLFPYHTYTKDWYKKISDFAEKNKQIKYIDLIPRVEDMMFLKYDTERIYLFTEGLPVNGWYKVFYIKNDNDFLINDNRVYGYIHKSQLSWGY